MIRHITQTAKEIRDPKIGRILKTTLADQNGVELLPGEAAEGFANLTMTGLFFKSRLGAARRIHDRGLPRYGVIETITATDIVILDEVTAVEKAELIRGLKPIATGGRWTMTRAEFLNLYELD